MNKRLRNYLIGIALVLIILPVLNFWSGSYWMHVFLIMGIMAIVTVSLNLALGFTGQMNLGHIAFFGIGAYLTGIMVKNYGWNYWLIMLFAGLLGVILAMMLVVATRKVRGVYLSIASFALLFAIQTVATNWTRVTGGVLGITLIPPPTIFGYVIRNTNKLVWGVIIFAFLLLFVFVVDNLMRSRVGRAFVTVRDDEDLAESSGVNVFIYKMISLCVGAFIAGVSGALYAAYMAEITPSAVGFTAALTVCVAICIGGIGTALGPIIGTAAVIFLPEILRPLGSHYYLFFAILVVTLAVGVPSGVMGILANWQGRRKRIKPIKDTLSA